MSCLEVPERPGVLAGVLERAPLAGVRPSAAERQEPAARLGADAPALVPAH
ncbi:hypothetical protein ACH9D2_05025 [Kocuria sp. M4R2S49]|uniref:hypothetical protein n=1 Tax=Kocuria rhizosphaericola TaxID=3376284 RepID=UPI0037882104